MKKTLFVLFAVLVAVYLFFSFISIKSEYNAEKKLWKINQEYADLLRSPETAPEQGFDELISRYKQYVEEFPASRLKPKVQIMVGRVYLLKKDYDAARMELKKVIELYPDTEELKLESLSAIAKSYELEDRWLDALKIYKEIQRDYPETSVALSVPLYIAQYYQENNKKLEADKAFADAVAYYNQMVRDTVDPKVEYKALTLLSVCYLAQEKWMETVKVLEKIILKYPIPQVTPKIIAMINNISTAKLNDYDIPIQIYKNFLERYPDHQLGGALREMIAAFERFKNENVVVGITGK